MNHTSGWAQAAGPCPCQEEEADRRSASCPTCTRSSSRRHETRVSKLQWALDRPAATTRNRVACAEINAKPLRVARQLLSFPVLSAIRSHLNFVKLIPQHRSTRRTLESRRPAGGAPAANWLSRSYVRACVRASVLLASYVLIDKPSRTAPCPAPHLAPTEDGPTQRHRK